MTINLFTETLSVAELQRIIARLIDYLELEASRRPDDPTPRSLRLVPKEPTT